MGHCIGRKDIIRRLKKLTGEAGRLFSGNRDILLSGFGLLSTYSPGFRPIILWDLGHYGKRDILSSWKDFILWDQDNLYSEIQQLILWDPGNPLGSGKSSGIWYMGNGKRYPLEYGLLISSGIMLFGMWISTIVGNAVL